MIAKSTDQRVSLALAVRRYVQTRERLHQATTEFDQACTEVRQHAEREARYVIQLDYRHWLLEVDAQGNFELEQIELL